MCLVPGLHDTGPWCSYHFPILYILILYLHWRIRECERKNESIGCEYRVRLDCGYRTRLRNIGITYSPDSATLPRKPSSVLQLSSKCHIPHHNDFEPSVPYTLLWISYAPFVKTYLWYDTGAHNSFPISCILMLYLHHSIREYAKKDEDKDLSIACGYSMRV